MHDVFYNVHLAVVTKSDSEAEVQMVLETKSGLEGGVIGGGHSVAAARLDAQRSVAGWVSEQMGGLSYLFYIRDLVSSLSPPRCNALASAHHPFHQMWSVETRF